MKKQVGGGLLSRGERVFYLAGMQEGEKWVVWGAFSWQNELVLV